MKMPPGAVRMRPWITGCFRMLDLEGQYEAVVRSLVRPPDLLGDFQGERDPRLPMAEHPLTPRARRGDRCSQFVMGALRPAELPSNAFITSHPCPGTCDEPSSLSDWGLRLIAANDFGGCGGAERWVGCRKRLKGPEIGVSWGPVCRAGAPQPCQAGTRANIRLMFQAMVTRLHSPRAPARPRSEN